MDSRPSRPALDQIFASPDYHCLGMGGDRAQFVRMDRRHYRESIFLDRRVSPLDPQIVELPINPLIETATACEARSIRWIFHVAHCGSTLLARLLDQPGGALVLREPPAMRQIGIERAEGLAGQRLAARFKLAHRLSSRQFDPGEPVLVKANVPVNFCLDMIAAFQPNAPSIMLYLSFQDYLLAILRTDNHRAWVLRITGTFRREIERQTGTTLGEQAAERAAALWLTQMRIYQAHLAVNPNAASLEAGRLFSDPIEIARTAAKHLGLDRVDPASNANALGSYSKDPSRAFDSATREDRARADRQRLATELKTGTEWLERAAALGPIPEQLDRAIAGS